MHKNIGFLVEWYAIEPTFSTNPWCSGHEKYDHMAG